jgi:hypothetical protein
MDPSNFVVSIVLALEILILTNRLQNASWIINSLKVYKSATLSSSSSSSARRCSVDLLPTLHIAAALATMQFLLSLL